MKKSKFLELIKDIGDNEDILIYNGFVQDWMDIASIEEVNMHHVTKKSYKEAVELQKQYMNKDFNYTLSPLENEKLNKLYKDVCKWKIEDVHAVDDTYKYHKKKVHLISTKERKEKFFDRIGEVQY